MRALPGPQVCLCADCRAESIWLTGVGHHRDEQVHGHDRDDQDVEQQEHDHTAVRLRRHRLAHLVPQPHAQQHQRERRLPEVPVGVGGHSRVGVGLSSPEIVEEDAEGDGEGRQDHRRDDHEADEVAPDHFGHHDEEGPNALMQHDVLRQPLCSHFL